MVTKKSRTGIPTAALGHGDTRRNIPTEELRDIVADEDAPEMRLYPLAA